jgi:hypothetical protein
MFDGHWRICYRSQDSAEKRTVKTPYFRRLENSRKILRNYVSLEDQSSYKEEETGATGWAHPQGAQAHPWPRRPAVRPP